MRILSGIIVTLVLVNSAIVVEAQTTDCTVSPRSAENEYDVLNAAGEALGYVALDSSGRWFAWVNSAGASNELYASLETARQYVCSEGQASGNKE